MNGIGSADHLQAALGGQYEIERELGGGGMSRTFVARDTALDRRVVIKVLPPDLAATVSHERFRREIMLSASLQHPNIVGILTADEVEGLPYFTMPFVDGESLRLRLQRGNAMPVGQAVTILRDVARALSYAHERGVVHRDIKPDNVLLTGGAAVVADFGVAKALSSARARRRDSEDETITSAGTALGTPVYMAPEQIAGDPNTDARADIYAFGVMAYEMLTGHPPFSGRPAAQLLAAHISEAPRHIASVRDDIPRALADLVMRCLAKDPAQRPQRAAEVAVALEDPAMVSGAFASMPSLPVVRARRKRSVVMGLAGVGAVAIAAGVFAVVQAGFFGAPPPPAPVVAAASARSIAVLPLVNLSADSADSFLADGITDELTSALSRAANFRVASNTAARAAQARGATPAEIGADLNVAYLLEGTVQRQGNRVRVTTRLVSVEDGFTAWADVYDRQASDLFKVQDEVAYAVVEALTAELDATVAAASAASVAAAPKPADPVAYEHYLRGRDLFKRRNDASLKQALVEFESAVKRDSGFARAHAGIASVYAVLPLYDTADPRTASARGLAAANVAIRLDTTVAEGYAARGALRMAAWRFDDAAEDFERALRFDANNALALQWSGELKLIRGDGQGAAPLIARARALDPASPIIGSVEALAVYTSGATDSALALAKRAVDYDPALAAPRFIYGTLLIDAGRARDAVKELEAARALGPNHPGIIGALASAYALAGDRARSDALRERVQGMGSLPGTAAALARIRLAQGDRAGALADLERAVDARDAVFTSEPLRLRFWDAIRAEPRFAAVVRRVGLGSGLLQPIGPPRS